MQVKSYQRVSFSATSQGNIWPKQPIGVHGRQEPTSNFTLIHLTTSSPPDPVHASRPHRCPFHLAPLAPFVLWTSCSPLRFLRLSCVLCCSYTTTIAVEMYNQNVEAKAGWSDSSKVRESTTTALLAVQVFLKVICSVSCSRQRAFANVCETFIAGMPM
eukprot:3282866-Pleurochrysis_carterae.AAC.1